MGGTLPHLVLSAKQSAIVMIAEIISGTNLISQQNILER
jgi:hypothetical protein